jgi:hypothetical protein
MVHTKLDHARTNSSPEGKSVDICTDDENIVLWPLPAELQAASQIFETEHQNDSCI